MTRPLVVGVKSRKRDPASRRPSRPLAASLNRSFHWIFLINGENGENVASGLNRSLTSEIEIHN